MRLAVLQMRAVRGDVRANLRRIERAAEEAADGGAECLVVPELAVTGYGAGPDIRDLAEPADGNQGTRLGELARKHRLTVVAGFAEAAGWELFNAALIVDPAGKRAVYRKQHLYGDYEKALFEPASGPPVIFETGGLKIGLLICYDVEFPEMVRQLAVSGADLVVVPTALPNSDHAPFIAERVVPVRAFENQVFLAYANHVGADDRFSYAGLSCIVAPDGADLVRADGECEQLLIAEVEPSRYAESRQANPYVTDLAAWKTRI